MQWPGTLKALKPNKVKHLAFLSLKQALEQKSDVHINLKKTAVSKITGVLSDGATSSKNVLESDENSTTSGGSSSDQQKQLHLLDLFDRIHSQLPEYDALFLDWDPNSLSKSIQMLPNQAQRVLHQFGDIENGKICRAINNEHYFKSAFSSEPLPSHCKTFFSIKCTKGTNFKIGIATLEAKNNPNQAFSDTKNGFAYFSNGQIRHNSKGSGAVYGEKFGQGDTIGVYVDLQEGKLIFSKNDKVFSPVFEGLIDTDRQYLAAACCLAKDESFELLEPSSED